MLVKQPGFDAFLGERDRWLDHTRGAQNCVDGIARLVHADEGMIDVTYSEDDEAAATGVRHPTHSLSKLSWPWGIHLELDGARLAARDQLSNDLLVHRFDFMPS
jgi:hypothetical protein